MCGLRHFIFFTTTLFVLAGIGSTQAFACSPGDRMTINFWIAGAYQESNYWDLVIATEDWLTSTCYISGVRLFGKPPMDTCNQDDDFTATGVLVATNKPDEYNLETNQISCR